MERSSDPAMPLVGRRGSSRRAAPAAPRPDDFIPFHRPYVSGREIRYLSQAVRSGSLSGDGPFTKKVQRLLERALTSPAQLHRPRVLLTNSCTTALEMAALLCKRGDGEAGEVILPGFTFVSTASAFVLHGYTPVFVDVRREDGNIDPERVAEAISPRTRAIVAVHYAGVPADVDALAELARPRGISVVEDAAQALGARLRTRPAGALGDLGCFSFHDTKNVSCGEGGALVVGNARLFSRAEHIREKGTDRSSFLRGEVDKYTWVDHGGSYLPSELQAAFLLAQLEHAQLVQERRQAIARRYRSGLAPLEADGMLRLGHTDPAADGNDHIFWLLLDGVERREALREHLAARGIGAHTHYVPLHLSPMGRRWGRGPGSLPVVEELGEGLLRLPMHPHLDAADVDRVVEAVREFFVGRRPHTNGG